MRRRICLLVVAAALAGIVPGSSPAWADDPIDCERTAEGVTCTAAEIVVVGEWWPDRHIRDIPNGPSSDGEPDGGHGAGGAAAHTSESGDKAAEAVDKRLHELLQSLLAREQRCAGNRQSLDAAIRRYTDAAARFVVADKELDIAWQEVFLAEAKTYADYYKNGMPAPPSAQASRQVLDGMINWLTIKLRAAKFDLARDKYDEALAEVVASQPPLDAAADAYDACLNTPLPPPPLPDTDPEAVDPKVCANKPHTPGC